jgi:hypothetical protein
MTGLIIIWALVVGAVAIANFPHDSVVTNTEKTEQVRSQ